MDSRSPPPWTSGGQVLFGVVPTVLVNTVTSFTSTPDGSKFSTSVSTAGDGLPPTVLVPRLLVLLLYDSLAEAFLHLVVPSGPPTSRHGTVRVEWVQWRRHGQGGVEVGARDCSAPLPQTLPVPPLHCGALTRDGWGCGFLDDVWGRRYPPEDQTSVYPSFCRRK